MQTSDRLQNGDINFRPQNFNQGNATILSPKKVIIGTGNKISALPPPYPSFFSLLPTTMFSILKGFQLIYFLAFAILLLFRYCSTQIGPMIAQLGFLLGYIIIQLAQKYLTYQSFVSNPFSNTNYDILDQNGWHNVPYQLLQVGQIIRINQKQRFPVTVLPIITQSMKYDKKQENFIFIDNFPITKTQQLAKIDIIKELKTIIDRQHQNLKVNSFDKCEIIYSFASSLGQIFEANLFYFNGGSEKIIKITNNNIIPRNITLNTEKYLIGVILYNLENDHSQDIKQIIYTRNGIDSILAKHIIIVIVINTILSLIIALAACFTIYFVNYHDLFSDLGCYFLNALTLLSHSIHITMYVALVLRRFIDAIIVNRKGNIQVRNYIQSLDEFGIVDTIISDDKLFLQRRLLQVQQIVEDPSQIKRDIILQLIQKTPKLKNLYPDQWLAVYRYNRQKKINKYNYKIGISGQRSDNCYGICIQYRGKSYLINFSNKAKYSLLQSANYGTKEKFNRVLENVHKKNLQGCFLTLPVQISEIDHYLSKEAMYISQNQMKLFCLIVFRVVIAEEPARLLRILYGKFNIILMTEKNWDMMENLLTFIGLKKNNEENMVTFQQLELQQFSEELRYRINAQEMDQYNLNLSLSMSSIRNKGSKYNDNRAFIYGFDASLITHLSRAQIRESLKILALKSKIMIFFNCKQYQKQICASNLFKIFNNNLFFTNFLCDQELCRRSNLSACLSIAPASPFTTISIDTYESLNSLLNQYSVYSIRTTLMIIYSFIFKNEVLIFGSLTSLFLIYRGHNFYTGLQYTDYIFLFYNLFFTLIPFIYYLIARPISYQSKIIPKYEIKLLFYQHLKGIALGVSLAFLLHAITAEQFAANIYLALLICSVIAANLYFLVLDHSVSKCIPMILILIQCGIIIGVFFLLLLVGYSLQDKIVLIQQNLSYANYWFFIGTFLIGIIFTVLVLFSISFITSLNHHLRSVSVESEELFLEKDLIGRVTSNSNKYSGKQMRFRQSIQMYEDEDMPLRKGMSIQQSKEVDIFKPR